jgi:predicted chitinase
VPPPRAAARNITMNRTVSIEQLQQMFPLAAKNIAANWPLVQDALELEGILTPECELAAAATIGVETAHTFAPIKEFGNTAYFTKHYENRADLGNTQPGDGAKFCGRGFVQITGRSNYENYGRKTNADLVTHPELALEPLVSAHILALFFKEHGVDKAANAGDWKQVRRRVNGGLNGYDDFAKEEEHLHLLTHLGYAAKGISELAKAQRA